MDVFSSGDMFASNNYNANPFEEPGYYNSGATQNYGPGSTPDIIYSYAADVNKQYPVYSDNRPPIQPSSSVSPSAPYAQRYSNPFKDTLTVAPPGPAPVDRESVAASSIDSFYGANSTAGMAM